MSALPVSAVMAQDKSHFTQRIVSVNQCVDQMLGYLAPEQLISVTWLSHADSDLAIRPTLARIPSNHAQIEEILQLKPDRVIGGQYGAPGLKDMMQRFNLPMQQIPLPNDFPGLYANWRQLAEWTGSTTRAEQIIHQLETGLDAARAQLAPLNIRVMMINPNGWIAGTGNFQDAFIKRLGLVNMAAETGLQGWGDVDLETLVNWSPDLIIVPQSHYTGLARATLWMEHPVLQRIGRRYPLLTVDAEHLSCGTPELLRTVTSIRHHILGKPVKLAQP